MSYKDALNDLDRGGERLLSEQMVDAFREAIGSGELAVGEKLPPTRELAEIAGVNHLTAVRVYRRLREQGLVTSQVGRGTFVRESAAAALRDVASTDGGEWQRYVLPAGAFFELVDYRIARVTNYYNLNDWLQQVGAG